MGFGFSFPLFLFSESRGVASREGFAVLLSSCGIDITNY